MVPFAFYRVNSATSGTTRFIQDDPAQLQLATSFYAIKKHHSCQKLPVFLADLAGNGRFGERSKNQMEGITGRRKRCQFRDFQQIFNRDLPGTKGAKTVPAVASFYLNLLNRSERQMMQTASKKSERKSPNRKTGIFEASSLHEQIEARAHQIYLDRGAEPGHELDDWLQAECEIMGWV
jgi:hypothetical protein